MTLHESQLDYLYYWSSVAANNSILALPVPSQIVIAFVAELTLYGFRHAEGLFAELLKILEEPSATAPAVLRRRCGSVGSDWQRRMRTWLRCWRRSSFLLGLPGLVLIEPAFEETRPRHGSRSRG